MIKENQSFKKYNWDKKKKKKDLPFLWFSLWFLSLTYFIYGNQNYLFAHTWDPYTSLHIQHFNVYILNEFLGFHK